jgi:arylsulfatase A-like enzyme
MRPGVTTLAEALQERGYRTAAVLTNPWVSEGSGLHRGFEEVRNEVMKSAEVVNRSARELMDSEDPRPLFLYLHYMDVHGPYGLLVSGPSEELGPTPASDRRAMSAEEIEALPNYLRIEGATELGDYVRAYDRGIRSWDRAFGELIAYTDVDPRLREAVVAVIADHGEELLDHGGWSHGGSLYQEQLFVPWIMRVPGIEGRRVREAVSLTDVGPTLLSLAGGVSSHHVRTGRVGEPLAPQATHLLRREQPGQGGCRSCSAGNRRAPRRHEDHHRPHGPPVLRAAGSRGRARRPDARG